VIRVQEDLALVGDGFEPVVDRVFYDGLYDEIGDHALEYVALVRGDLLFEDKFVPEPELAAAAQRKAEEMGRYYGPNYAALKGLLRYPIVEEWSRREEDSIQKFVEIWYSPETRAKTREIKIF